MAMNAMWMMMTVISTTKTMRVSLCDDDSDERKYEDNDDSAMTIMTMTIITMTIITTRIVTTTMMTTTTVLTKLRTGSVARDQRDFFHSLSKPVFQSSVVFPICKASPGTDAGYSGTRRAIINVTLALLDDGDDGAG
eukprot:1065538-Rhodomonas_salina.1